MAQYNIINQGTHVDLSDGSDYFRYVNITGVLYLRQTITPTGFDGDKGTDWDDIETYADSGGGVWRIGVRDSHWVKDCTITGVGFDESGVENTDWENYEKHQL